jgi:hypothetical protein
LTEKHGYVRSHDSLADAIRDATRCVQSGRWVVENGSHIIWPARTTAYKFAHTGIDEDEAS